MLEEGKTLKILFVSGFLGAGKTRFIVNMSRATGRKFVIVENEFGELDVDAQRLRQDGAAYGEPASAPEPESGPAGEGEEAPGPFSKIVELSEGCICCSLNIDFTHSLLTIANTLNPDYLVVEPSGVAKTGNILEKIRSICYERISILAPITIVDGRIYEQSRRNNPDIFLNQLQVAGTLVVSHSEDFTREDFDRIARDLKLPADTRFPRRHYEQWTKEEWEELLCLEYAEPDTALLPEEPAPEEARRPDASVSSAKARVALRAGRGRFRLKRSEKKNQELQSIGFSDYSLDNVDDLIYVLNILISGVVGRVARAKGYFRTSQNESVTFDVVEGLYAITGIPLTDDSRAVVIGEGLKEAELARLFGASGSFHLNSTQHGEGAAYVDSGAEDAWNRRLEEEEQRD